MDKEYRQAVFPGSRPAGAAVNLAWLGGLMIAGLLIFSLLPTSVDAFGKIQQKIDQSRICQWTGQNVFSRIPLTERIFSVLSVLEEPRRLAAIMENAKIQALLSDPRFEEIAEDPDIVRFYENKQMVALLFHPKITGLLNDSRMMQKITRLVKLIYKEGTKDPQPQDEQPVTSPHKTPQKSVPEDPDPPAGP